MTKLTTIIISLFLISCSDETLERQNLDLDSSRGILTTDASIPTDSNIRILDFMFPDAYVDPCISATSSDDNFCECQPQCCQIQQWYCPPSGLGVNALDVVMNICDDNFQPCDRSTNFNCPPNEVLSQGECRSILECPPSIDNDITITVRCEIEGVEGTQRIICSKGNIEYQECITCTPSEERCNYTDDDCDGQIDEGQRNVCDSCGPIPAESCNGEDDDCDGTTDEELVRECETLCERGVETCSDGGWISCTATRPQEEQCDGADNDCDGIVDEQLNCLCDVDDVGNLQPCSEPPLRCGQGFKTCECVDEDCTELRMSDCLAFCSYFPAQGEECDPRLGMALDLEECNAFDEDCDDLLDEGLTQGCYTGAPETLNVGVCAPGEAYCHMGAWGSDRDGAFVPGFCSGEVTPGEEVCDGADNDCDGVVDYGEQIRDTDILFIVDWSGSMDDEIAAVKIALNQFAQQFAAEDTIRWGLIIGPKEFPDALDQETLVLVSDIAPFGQFLASFAALGSEGMDTGSEMLLDAVYLAVRNISPAAAVNLGSTSWWRNTGSIPEKENFTINWRAASDRVVIVFSDELEQSYLRDAADPEGPSRPISRPIVENVVRAGINLRLYTFSAPFSGRWEDIALAGNGMDFRLTSDAVSMYNDLMSIIDEACLPREQHGYRFSPTGIYKYASHMLPHYDYELFLCY